MITPSVSPAIRAMLEGVFSKVVVVDVLDSGDSAHLALLKRPELGVTFTKLHCWALTEYSKCVFLDADILCVQNADELFSHPELTAVCDIGWPDCFNSGMFVFTPSQETYTRLLQHAETSGSFDGGDQGLLNTFFSDWQRVSFMFNMVASATYTYLPAFKQYGGDAKLVHFLGSMKPWQHRFDRNSGSVDIPSGYQHLAPYLNSWWAIYMKLVQPGVPDMDLQNVQDGKCPLADVQEVTECLQTVDKEEHIEMCDSLPVFIEEVKAEPSVHSPERCDTGPLIIETVENEGIVDRYKVPPNVMESHEPVGESFPSPLCLEEIDGHGDSFKGPYTVEESNWCVSIEIDIGKDNNERKATMESEGKDRDASMASEGSELTTTAESELLEVAHQLSDLKVHEESVEEGKARWERGEPDYLGRDSFDNIQAYIDAKLKNGK